MRNGVAVVGLAIIMTFVVPAVSWRDAAVQAQDRPPVTFTNDVFPIIKKHCLPCHAEDNFNPSGLSLDTYDALMAGGEHGKAVEPGKGTESVLIKKLGPEPPFGKTMPVVKKKQQAAGVVNKLTEEEIKVLIDWIDQGAKND